MRRLWHREPSELDDSSELSRMSGENHGVVVDARYSLMPLRVWLLGVAIVGTLVAAAVFAITSALSGGRITLPGGFEGGVGIPVQQGQPASLDQIMLCVMGTSKALSVRAVVPIQPTGDLRVTGFETRPNPNLASSAPVGAQSAAAGARAVQPCEPSSAASEGQPIAPTELVVMVATNGAHRVTARGLSVQYRDDHGREHSLTVPLTLVLCPGAPPATCSAM